MEKPFEKFSEKEKLRVVVIECNRQMEVARQKYNEECDVLRRLRDSSFALLFPKKEKRKREEQNV